MGRLADKKLKRRRADQKTTKRANSNSRELKNNARGMIENLAEEIKSATSAATLKGINAHLSEVVEMVREHPEEVRTSAGMIERYTRRAGDSLDVSEFPNVKAKLQTAFDLATGDAHELCEHAREMVQGISMCTIHPGDGLRCFTCHHRHVSEVHSTADEFRCDECGEVDRRGMYPIHPTPLVGAVIREPDGGTRRYPGVLMVIGVGTCERCYRAPRKRRQRST